MAKQVKIGITFRAVYADSMATWKVIKHEGGTAWVCEVNKQSEWAGAQKMFSSAEILGAIRSAEAIGTLMNDHDRWINSLKLRQIVHYDNGFKQYVRCQIVMGKAKNDDADQPDRKVLMPIALVGNWRESDKPSYDIYGDIKLSHYVEMIEKAHCFCPNYTCIYESPVYSRKGDPDGPAKLTPMDLTPPPLSQQRIRTARVYRKIRGAQQLLDFQNMDTRYDSSLSDDVNYERYEREGLVVLAKVHELLKP